MLQAFVFEKVAVLVLPWHEPVEPPECGARVEVRLLGSEPARGSYAAAQRVVIDRPVFRADFFDRMDHPPGNLRSAHFHPHFHGVEPCDRQWNDAIQADPLGWLAGELGGLAALLARAGVDAGDAVGVERDAVALRATLPAVTAAVQRTWEAVRSERAISGTAGGRGETGPDPPVVYPEGPGGDRVQSRIQEASKIG